MTWHEARAVIARAIHGVNTSVPLSDTVQEYREHVYAQADAALDGLFAHGVGEHRARRRAPHGVRSCRVVTLVRELEDENDERA